MMDTNQDGLIQKDELFSALQTMYVPANIFKQFWARDGGVGKSWIAYDADSHFPLENIPFGVFVNPKTGKPSCCTRVGGVMHTLLEAPSSVSGGVSGARALAVRTCPA